MSSKHLAAGSPCPPREEGKLRIYSMRFCPYAQRALLVAAAKNIPHDVVNCNLTTKPEFLLEKNPLGQVPTVQFDDKVLCESLIVADFLDEQYPGRLLQPSTPYQKAHDRILVSRFDKVILLYYRCLTLASSGSDNIAANATFMELLGKLPEFEMELEKRGSKFFGGNEAPGMLDYMIWPWFERLPIVALFFDGKIDYKSVKPTIPNLDKWDIAMQEDEAVKTCFLSPAIHFKYAQSRLAGSSNYDILDDE